MAYDPSIFNINPYYDDFDPTKGFLRMLFKPGYAIQARELTQLQTILQGQVSKIGDHLFKDGSRIVGGGISIRNANYVMFSVSGATNPLASIADYSTLVGGYLTATGFRAKVVHYLAPDPNTDSNLVLVLDFISGGSVPSTVTFTKDSTTYTLTPVTTTGYSGVCKLITVDEGIFYVDGFFARNERLLFSPFRTVTVGGSSYRDLTFGTEFALLSKKIGFAITRDSITEQEDSTLRDPAIGSYNYNAPGADRYKIVFAMSQLDLTSNADDFVELLRFSEGKITKKIERVTYGEIQNVMARRTYDESGSYVVQPFDTVVRPRSTTTFDLSVGAGKAYVQGYEVESRYPQTVSLPRAQTTQSETQGLVFSTGNFINVAMGNTVDHVNALVTIGSGSARVVFRTGTVSAPGTVTATGFVHGYVPNLTPGAATSGFTASLYLYGITGSVSSGVVGFIYDNTTGNTLGNFTYPANTSVSGTDNQSLVFPITPGYAINDLTQGFSIQGKLVSNSITPTNTGTVTTYTLTKSNFTDTVPSANSGVISFVDYLTGNPTNLTDLQEIALVSGVVGGVTAGRGFVPAQVVGTTLSNNGNATNEIKLEINPAPNGFTGNAVRLVVPVKYTPTLSNTSTYRYKTSVSATQNITSSVSDLKTDENNRKYYELTNTDVYSISSVISAGTNYTEDFELDDGQRETYYQRARLYVKKSVESLTRYSNSAVPLVVSYLYFRHDGLAFAPFIGKYSYLHGGNPTFTYEQIPLFTNPRTGKTVSLANCLDFRHSGLTSATPMIKPYGTFEFGVDQYASTVNLTYNHYLPRIDKLCVKADPDDGSALFFLVQGTPDLSPVAPPDPIDALVLGTLTVPAYTHNIEDVSFTPANNKRYTMSDIGKLEKRIDDVEVFAKLSLSEAEMEARSLRLTSGVAEPLKTSILSDEFYGHSVSDVSSDEHVCSVDFERGELRPFFTAADISPATPSLSNTTISSDGLLTLSYTAADYITNLQYSKTVKPNPSNTVNWLGFMKLGTSVIPKMDSGYRPLVRTNSLMENDNWRSSNAGGSRGFGTQWNDWESLWTGIEEVEEEQDDVQKSVLELPRIDSVSAVPPVFSGNVRARSRRNVESVNQKNSNFIRSRNLRNRIREKVGSRVVDRSVVGYIPTTSVSVTAYGMKPSTTGLSLFFDGISLAAGLATDANGTCTTTFTIPAGTFLTGNRTVRISDSATIANATTSAEETLYCTGALVQQDSGSYSTRPPSLRRRTVNSETISKDPFNKGIDGLESVTGIDPLSQTFFVDRLTNPEGVFLSSVSLYFSSKDTVLPVAVDIRPTVSGYPSPSVVMPFSTVVKLPADVAVNSTTPTETEFQFSSPVYLPPGEYAICVSTNSEDYSLFAAETATNGVAVGDAVAGRAGNNQLVGTLYAPQGSGAAVQDNSTDLMFSVKRCAFGANTGTATSTGLAAVVGDQAFKISAPEIIPEGCTITRNVGGTVFANNETVYPLSLFTAAPSLVYTLTRGVSNAVSPVIDTAARYGNGITMLTGTAPSSTSKYVTRVVELPSALASRGLAVFLDANIPSGTEVKVRYRTSLLGEADIFVKPWIDLPRTDSGFSSTSEIDFREAAYRTAVNVTDFKSYQIRVELIAPSGATYYKTPAVRSVRVVSFI